MSSINVKINGYQSITLGLFIAKVVRISTISAYLYTILYIIIRLQNRINYFENNY